jgi:hypothetical protein
VAGKHKKLQGERKMFDNEFDPYQSMINMDNNIKNLIAAHNLLARRVEEQQEVIDVLIKGLNAANKANAQMLEQGLNNLYTNFTSTGQH